MGILRKFELPIFFIIFAAILWLGQPSGDKPHAWQGDDLRYISYAVSLHKHGVFGLSSRDTSIAPEPGNANAPFYPALITGVMALDPSFAESMVCTIEKNEGPGCEEHFRTFFIVQMAFALLCLFLIYLTARQFSRSHLTGWIAAFLAAASGVFSEFSNAFMTEILILPAFCALLLFCQIFYQDGRLRWIGAIALMLAVLTLIRPSYLYLFYGFAAFLVVTATINRTKSSWLRLGVLVVTFIMIVSPWAIRNKTNFDSFTLTSGGYAEAILVQRINYNQMSWPEVGVAMLYWLPDFGDSLAKKVFPTHLHDKLGWNENSYYGQGYGPRIEVLSKELGGSDKILGHLIKEEVLTPKHIAVSVPLALRGTFIAKYWGLVGFIAFIALLIQTLRQKDYTILIISLPLFYMVAFHAGLSVSIPRYNLPLVTIYALSMAYYINIYGQKIVTKIRTQ
ncbi:MAG: hypothetical protein DHS20C02_12790 [Micavibrio sp.]|nr:MAG: hypothetical protein DHS20C02_12790 [Micavibrio sp.]